MAAKNTTYNKVIYHDKTLIDLTGDTVTADKIFSGYTAHDKSGKKITGTFMSDLPFGFGVEGMIEDDNGNTLFDDSNVSFIGEVMYRMV